MKLILRLIHGFLMISTIVVSMDFYNPDYLGIPIPPILHSVVLIGVPGISAIWAIGHILVAGGLFAISSGGSSLWEGLMSGGIIGMGMAVGRLWPFVMCWSLGAFFAAQNMWHAPVAFVVGLLFLGIERIVKYIWNRVENAP